MYTTLITLIEFFFIIGLVIVPQGVSQKGGIYIQTR